MSTPYPFSAIVGLDDLELALVLNAVSPAIGGVLVRGEKGTAKSTIVRGLAALLPPVSVVVTGAGSAAIRRLPIRCARTARIRPVPPVKCGRRGSSSFPSARARTGWSARSTWSGP